MHDRLEFLSSLNCTGVGVELGVQSGWFSHQILTRTRLRKLYSIDPWDKPPGSDISFRAEPELYLETLKLLWPFGDRSYVLRMLSVPAAELFAPESLDFVYIDANHWYPEVTADIAAYWPKIAPGGILAGHDYGTFHTDVTRAVNEFVTQQHLQLHLTDCDETYEGHAIRTWWVVKG